MRVLLRYNFGFQTLNFAVNVHMCSVIHVVFHILVPKSFFKVMVNHGCGCQTGRWKKKKNNAAIAYLVLYIWFRLVDCEDVK